MQPKPTFADGYADAMQGLPLQSEEEEYVTGFNSLQEEVDSGFAGLESLFPVTNLGANDV